MRKGSKTGKPAWNANPIYKDCLTCGKIFRTILAKIKEGKGKFCSKECYLKKHMENTWTEGVCAGCNKKFRYVAHRKQICCSLSCNAKWKRNKYGDNKRITKNCEQCGKKMVIFKTRLNDDRGKFCSKKCYSNWMSINNIGENSPGWKNGKTPFYKKIRTLSKYYDWREKILKRDKNKCVLCGEKNKTSLIVDHIIGLALIIKKNNIENTLQANLCENLWDINNGRVLCKKCHIKTDNYGMKGWI